MFLLTLDLSVFPNSSATVLACVNIFFSHRSVHLPNRGKKKSNFYLHCEGQIGFSLRWQKWREKCCEFFFLFDSNQQKWIERNLYAVEMKTLAVNLCVGPSIRIHQMLMHVHAYGFWFDLDAGCCFIYGAFFCSSVVVEASIFCSQHSICALLSPANVRWNDKNRENDTKKINNDFKMRTWKKREGNTYWVIHDENVFHLDLSVR